jgi:cytochrome c peroxidase
MYSPYFPMLQYNQAQGDFYGGNFWDLRATGVYLQICTMATLRA